ARHFAEHLFASGLGELAHLRLDTLAVGRDAGIAVFHAAIMQQVYAAKKRNRFNGLILLRFSSILQQRGAGRQAESTARTESAGESGSMIASLRVAKAGQPPTSKVITRPGRL